MKNDDDSIPADLPEMAGKKSREIAAQKAGFSSTTIYRQAKHVVDDGVPELVDAIDKGLAILIKIQRRLPMATLKILARLANVAMMKGGFCQ